MSIKYPCPSDLLIDHACERVLVDRGDMQSPFIQPEAAM